MYKKNGNIEKLINNYLKEIELCKWKMKMSATKCNYIIFHNGSTRPKLLDLKLFGINIPFEANPVFLGATFDERLTFNKFFDKISTSVM
jgi:cell fate regulator YaaT (PSP1 superfamily)